MIKFLMKNFSQFCGLFGIVLGFSTTLRAQSGSQNSINCPQSDRDFVGGCIIVPEDYTKLNDSKNDQQFNKIQIFYQWYKNFDPQKETIIILSGGPGGSLKFYSNSSVLLSLQNKYNVLFYDQRGVDRSSFIDEINLPNIDLKKYHTRENVEDLLQIINSVILDSKKVILIGHSYGAHLAYAFGAKYPEKVKKLIALNGALDSLGFVLQGKKKAQILIDLFNKIDQKDLIAFYQLVQSDQIINENFQPFTFKEFSLYLTWQISFYSGANKALDRIDKLINLNRENIEKIKHIKTNPTESHSKSHTEVSTEVSTEVNRRFYSFPNQLFNFYVNSNITCSEFINPYTYEPLTDTSIKEPAEMYFLLNCSNIKQNISNEDIFNIIPTAINLNFPILMIGGSHDPLVAIEAQSRDFTLLSEHLLKDNVEFVEFKNTGHQVIEESPLCLKNSIETFLDRSNFKSLKRDCVETEFGH